MKIRLIHIALNVIAVVILLQYFAACKPGAGLSGTNVAQVYSASAEAGLMLLEASHLSDSISQIGVTAVFRDISQTKDGKNNTYRLRFEVYRNTRKSSLFMDTTVHVHDTAVAGGRFTYFLKFAAATGHVYLVRTKLSGNRFNDEQYLLTEIDKRSKNAAPWFQLTDETGKTVTGNSVGTGSTFTMKAMDPAIESLEVRFFGRNFELPAPPFSLDSRRKFDYRADSSFRLNFSNGISERFNPVRNGIYFFMRDTSVWQGPALLACQPGFPKITQHSAMVESLRYITSSREYPQLLSAPSARQATDSFWISSAGTADLAAEMIRRYYTRVEDANRFFTSFTEGWKTDRGMIYIVFGKPSQVFRSFEGEVWVYGENASPSALKFFFNRVDNPFTANDFLLERREYYKSAWYQYVQSWRR